MVTVPVTIPRAMAPYLDRDGKGLTMEQRAMLLYPMIQQLVISHGRAAELLGISKTELIELYDSMGIPYLRQSSEELDEEIAGFAHLRRLRAV